MRILHVINSTNPAGGGPIESIRQANRVLAPQGHVFEIACLDAPGSPWLADLGITTQALGPAFSKYRYSPRYLPWLRWNIANYDAAIVHGIWLYPSLAAWLAARREGVPYFVYTHGLLDPAVRRVFPLKHVAKAALWRLIERRVVRDAKAVFFTGEEERRLAGQSFRPFQANGVIVPYCVGGPEGDPDRQKQVFVERFPECRGKRLILFLSRIHVKKGCDLLIEAFARAAQDPVPRLVMAGPDSTGWRAALEARAQALGIADRITWTGMLAGDLKWGAFRAADVFILPSHQENFGIAVVEALACGAPVLITKRINIWREITDDGAGLADEDDLTGTGALLQKWLALAPAQQDAMRDAARRCFASRFRSEQAAETLLGALRAGGVRS